MAEVDETLKKKRTYKKYTYRGVDLGQFLVELMHSRAHKRFSRGLKHKHMVLIKKLREAEREAPSNEKPEIVKPHLRNMTGFAALTGSIIGIYIGKDFDQVEVKPEMIRQYLGEFVLTYKPVKRGRPVIEVKLLLLLE